MLVATFILAFTAVILLVCIITKTEDGDRVLYSFPFGDFPHMRIIPLINNSENNHRVSFFDTFHFTTASKSSCRHWREHRI